MKPKACCPSIARPKKQRGIATVLIVVLIGVALTATSLGMMHSIRSTQAKQVAVHAATHAQTGAWTGVEVFRLFLSNIDTATLLALPNSVAFNVGGGAFGTMSATNISVVQEADYFVVKADIINAHADARASTAVGVVYQVEKLNPPNTVKLDAALDFHDDLDVGGKITFITPVGQRPVINVDGSVSMLNVGLSHLGILNAAGSVTLDSDVVVDEINSNDNVSLTGAAQVGKVSTRGTVFTKDNGGARIIWANGAVTISSSYRSDAVNSLSTIEVTQGRHGDMKAKEAVTVGSNFSTNLDEIQSKDNIKINSTGVEVGKIVGEKDLLCTVPWKKFQTASLNGKVDSSCLTAGETTLAEIEQNNVVPVMEEIAPITIPRMVIDVWTLKVFANYIFEWDSAMERTKVTVNHISGIPDGSEFWVGNYPGNPPKKSFLCSDFNVNGDCTAPMPGNLGLCIGHSDYNECFSYNTATETWSFNGINATPGILWFKGSVILDNGYNYSTVLATGDVATAGGMKIESVNYAGYDAMCKAKTNAGSKYTQMFEDQIPTNMCDTDTNTFNPLDVGNIAIAAGGYNPANNGSYSGGNIKLGASNEVFGIVLAGGYLETGGYTQVYGHVSAAVQGPRGSQDNLLQGNTTVDLTRGNEYYKPNIVPNMGGGACPDCEELTTPQPGSAEVRWSKYL